MTTFVLYKKINGVTLWSKTKSLLAVSTLRAKGWKVKHNELSEFI